jgi:hypothetical protein
MHFCRLGREAESINFITFRRIRHRMPEDCQTGAECDGKGYEDQAHAINIDLQQDWLKRHLPAFRLISMNFIVYSRTRS